MEHIRVHSKTQKGNVIFGKKRIEELDKKIIGVRAASKAARGRLYLHL
jgi:hypothetical protein